VYLDFRDAIQRLGRPVIEERYGNLFEMYERITGEDPYRVPMKIYPAPHYTMGGLWVDYNLMTTVPGLFALGEANFSDHGANRLGASALMQGLADGSFIVPYTLADYLATTSLPPVETSHAAFRQVESEVAERLRRLLAVRGKRTSSSFHRELGRLLWNEVGMSRNEAGLGRTLDEIPRLRAEFWENVTVPGDPGDFNMALERAGRVADYLEFAELLTRDALDRSESCGGHFREEHQMPDGEAKRNDADYSHVSVWEHREDAQPVLHKEPLSFEVVKPSQRSYK
jgi:succinate dehydrogenase / fumarate reductase flavoprotein subunit